MSCNSHPILLLNISKCPSKPFHILEVSVLRCHSYSSAFGHLPLVTPFSPRFISGDPSSAINPSSFHSRRCGRELEMLLLQMTCELVFHGEQMGTGGFLCRGSGCAWQARQGRFGCSPPGFCSPILQENFLRSEYSCWKIGRSQPGRSDQSLPVLAPCMCWETDQ